MIDEAVCIRQWDWSETSQTVSLFTREHGIVRGVAKGAKREKAPFSGGLEVLTRGEATAILKPSADLANITAWDLQEVFPALRRSLPAFYAGMYMADLVHHALSERDPHPRLFERLLGCLRAVSADEVPAGAVLRFQWATLDETGYRPEVGVDVATGGPLAEARTYTFLPRLGGFSADAAGAPGPAWRARAETVAILRQLGGNGELGVRSPQSLDRANRLLAAYVREVLGREVPAAAALFGELRA